MCRIRRKAPAPGIRYRRRVIGRMGMRGGGLGMGFNGGSTQAYGSYDLALDFKNNQYRQVRTRTNKVTVVNANPTDLTGLTKSGDAAATLTLVSDTAALAAAGLSSLCTSGNVWKLDNSAGVAAADVTFAGVSGNTNTHTASAWLRGSGLGGMRLSGGAGATMAIGATYQRYQVTGTPGSGTIVSDVRAAAGAVVYFILPQFEEAPQASAIIVTTGAAASVTENYYTATPIRTNLLAASNDYSQAVWGKTDTTIDYASAVASPDGYPLALVTEGSAGTAILVQSATLYQPQVTATYSCVLVRGNHDWLRVSVVDQSGSANGVQAWFNLATGAAGTVSIIGTGTNVTSAITSLGGGAYRVSVSVVLPLPTTGGVTSRTNSAASNGTTTRVSAGTRYQGQSQLEIGTTATAYINNPNTTAGNCQCTDGPSSLYGYSYSRTGAKGEIKSDGSIISQPAGVPAIIPGDGYWSRAALTNLILRSIDYSNATWNLSSTAQAVGQTAPDGSATATLLTESGAAAVASQGFTVAAATSYTVSAVRKRGNHDWVRFVVWEAATPANRVSLWANLATGALGTFATAGTGFTAVGSASATALANGFYRVAFTFQSGTATGLAFFDAAAAADNTTAHADVGGGAGIGCTRIAWQSQCVLGTQPGPIIVTTSATATVGADVEGQPLVIADEDFVIFEKAVLKQAGTSLARYFDWAPDANNAINAYLNVNNQFVVDVKVATVAVFSATSAVSATVDADVVVALRRRAGKWTIAVYIGGSTTIGTETTAGIPTGTATLYAGNRSAGDRALNGLIRGLYLRKGTFTDADLTAMMAGA